MRAFATCALPYSLIRRPLERAATRIRWTINNRIGTTGQQNHGHSVIHVGQGAATSIVKCVSIGFDPLLAKTQTLTSQVPCSGNSTKAALKSLFVAAWAVATVRTTATVGS